MMRFLRTALTWLIGLLFPLSLAGQNIKWNTIPQRGLVFQITNKEAKLILTRTLPDTIFHGLLHTQVDTFNVGKGWLNRPSKGHFILVNVEENKLRCEYTSVFPYQVFLLKEYDALSLQVVDLDGNVREDAKVKMKLRRLRIDPETKTYRIENDWVRGDKTVTVELDGFLSVFDIEKHEVPEWHNNYYYRDDGPDFYSYMITDKNKYKPNEKVRFKSFALSNSRSPLHRELEIWLVKEGKPIRIGKVSPHRPGSYAGEFQLHDSLKLTLDKFYNINLVEKKGRIVSSTKFKYEDYELNGDKLEAHLSTTKQFYPASNELSILATDANGLPLKDAHATILVIPENIRETFQPVVVLKDSLMFMKVDLNPTQPTIIKIPSDIFQKTNTTYKILVTVLNSQNQQLEQAVFAQHYYSQYELTARFSNDSIVYELLDNLKPVLNAPIKLRHNDEMSFREVVLPYKEMINATISRTYLSGDVASKEFDMSSLLPQLEFRGGIENDSFKIELHNPQQLEVSWYIYQGSILLQKGSGKEMEYASLILNREQTYYAELLYSFGGADRLKRKDYEFKDGQLNVLLDIPERVYPGQKVDATIKVTNDEGIPVSGVDLTAIAVSGKLDYYIPDLAYYRKSSDPRPKKATYSKYDVNKKSAMLKLDYNKWDSKVGLDSMKYYQFTYPYLSAFVHKIDIDDSTQFAPYVMQDGAAKQIYVIELNREPIYYSWTDEPSQYSFYVPEKGWSQVTLRLFDRVLIFDSLSFTPGKKTVISVDLDHLPEDVRVYKIEQGVTKKNKRQKVYPSFTSTEIKRHLNYLAYFKNRVGNAYLEVGKTFTPLFRENGYSQKDSIKVGPIRPGMNTFIAPYTKTTYQHTGGYTYAFQDNIVYKLRATKLIPDRLHNISYKPMSNINEVVMTRKNFLKIDFPVNVWHTRFIDLADNGVHVKIVLPVEEVQSGLATFLFQGTSSKKLISPCNRYLVNSPVFNIPRGLHNAIVIYNNGTYLKMDSIDIKPFSKVVIDLDKTTLQPADSSSRKWREAATANCFDYTPPKVTTYRRSGPIIGNIRGTVLDNSNLPIPGANVVIKGTVNGTVSDVDGQFVLDADESVVILVVSFVGYATKELEVQSGSEVSLFLEEDVQSLMEVVVVGYGVDMRSASLSYALQGMAAGVQVSRPDVTDVTSEPYDEIMPDADQQLYHELLALNSIRSHFSDVGFWEPKLFTDRRGLSRFTITFPDDITRWDATVLAMNRQLQTGTVHQSIKSYKPIMAELSVPHFLTQGDSAFFQGNVSNYSGDKNITGKVKWNGAGTDFEKEIKFSEFNVDKLPVNPLTPDSIITSYVFTRDDGYLDGEERRVPVIEQGLLRANGSLSILQNNEEVHVRATDEKVTIEIMANQLDLYAGEARYLLNYKYDCNEQLASKLLGLISYRMLMRYEDKPFLYDKDVNKIIARLLENQNEEFLWSWWDVSITTSYWMSSHILRALKVAQEAGYTVDLDIENIKRKAEYKFDILQRLALDDIELVHALAMWNAALNYPKHLKILDSLLLQRQSVVNKYKKRYYEYPYSLLKEKLQLVEIRQMAHLPYQRDSLLRYQVKGIMGDLHFTDNKRPSYWYNDELIANTIAYRIVKRDSSLKHLTLPMQLYFLAERRKGEWNTYHSSNVLTTVLGDLVAEGVNKKNQLSVKLSGKVNGVAEKFPYHVELLAGEEINIRKESGLPAYFMQYTTERVKEAKTGVEGFEIKTILGNNQTVLEAGQAVTLRVEVSVNKDAKVQHVMIEVPIPGACSYQDKPQSQYGVETHREYFQDRTVIFCENMAAGKYAFEIPLLPRFTGTYNINPAQVSLMYVPVVNANTDMKVVKVR